MHKKSIGNAFSEGTFTKLFTPLSFPYGPRISGSQASWLAGSPDRVLLSALVGLWTGKISPE